MLEVKNLKKVYKNKKGANTNALNDITLAFEEKGMVFLLGKSGSGKSTLLNVIGGLDSPTSGEVIVKGRSSKDFSQSDFDSYRNTFIGFIFQEYNILNGFTVEDNIALALELQNKRKDKEAVNNLLKQVDLEGFGKRKPNTLSGGQKQRIAIARALIKNPEIIMADEPTGALDSMTGTQVLDTLKKLSKERLVIVVSHDREFAENYADRIIELKDGKVISDISKVKEESLNLSNNVKLLGNTLVIKKGNELDRNDFEEVFKFLKNSNEEIILSTGTEEIKNIKKINKITDSGDKEVFKQTNEENIKIKTYTKEESKFIKSKLPLRHAFKMGLSSLKSKPIRLLFTIILCTTSFIMFGILSTMTFYNSESVFKESLKNSTYSYIKLSKQYEAKSLTYYKGEEPWKTTEHYNTPFSKEELNNYIKDYGNKTFYAVNIDMKVSLQSNPTNYYLPNITGVAYLTNDNELIKNITGTYPKKDDEVLISSYTAEVIFNNKVLDSKTGKVLKLNKKEDIIGKNISIGGTSFKVTGILNTKEIHSKYDILKTDEGKEEYSLISSFQTYLSDELHTLMFTTESTLNKISKVYGQYTYGPEHVDSYRYLITSININKNYNYDEYSNSNYTVYNSEYSKKTIYINKEETIEKNNILINEIAFGRFMYNYFSKLYEEEWNEEYYNYMTIANKLSNSGYYENDELIEIDEKTKINIINKLLKAYKKYETKITVSTKLANNDGQSISDAMTYKVVGIYYENIDTTNYSNITLILSKDKVKELWNIQKDNLDYYTTSKTSYKPVETNYEIIYVPYDKSEESTNKLKDIYIDRNFKKDGSDVSISSTIILTLQMIDDLVDTLSKVFLIVGLVLAVFSIMLFSNFISVSISNKKNEIGILRAIGARGLDVFRIFFSESFVITLICVVFSSSVVLSICTSLNAYLAEELGISLFVFGLPSFLTLVLISIVTAILSTSVPVFLVARKKPVESIRAI